MASIPVETSNNMNSTGSLMKKEEDSVPQQHGTVSLPSKSKNSRSTASLMASRNTEEDLAAAHQQAASCYVSQSMYMRSLCVSFVKILEGQVYHRTLGRCMPLQKRVRLEALRRQVVFGDAPADGSTTTSQAKGSSPISYTLKRLQPAGWFDYKSKLEWQVWEELRGTDKSQAAEMLCSELREAAEEWARAPGVTAELQPLLHAALSRAHYESLQLNRAAAAAGGSGSQRSISSEPFRLHVRALQGDPAALTMLWACQAYGIPAHFTFDPLPLLSSGQQGHPGVEDVTGVVNYEPTFEAALCHLTGTGEEVRTEVHSVVGAFMLLADRLLNPYRYLCGESCSSSAAASSGQEVVLAQERAAWADAITHVTSLLRTPLLQLMVDGKLTEEVRLFEHAAEEPEELNRSLNQALIQRTRLLRITADRFHRLEHVLESASSAAIRYPPIVSRGLWSSLSNAPWRVADAPQKRSISLLDIYLATCGYQLATHPYCADLYPCMQSELTSVRTGGAYARVPQLYGLTQRSQRQPILALLEAEEKFTRLHRHLSMTLDTLTSAAATVAPSTSSSPVKLSTKQGESLILARILTCSADLTSRPGPPSRYRTPPFAVLACTLAYAWRLVDQQCPGFPSLLMHYHSQHTATTTSSSSSDSNATAKRVSKKSSSTSSLLQRLFRTASPPPPPSTAPLARL